MADLEEQQAVNAMWQLIDGGTKTHLVRAFVELGLPEQLDDGSRDVADLAEALGARVQSLGRFLRAAGAIGLCVVDDAGRATLTPLGQTLKRGRPSSLADWSLLMTSPLVVRPWLALADSIRTGRAAFPDVYGVGMWEYLGSHADDAAAFDAAMTGSVAARAEGLRAAVDLSSVGTIVDVGGGQGQLLASLLTHLPHVQGILADRGEVLDGAPAVLRAAGVADRVSLVPTDFFEVVPAAGDAYVLSRILHDWPDREAVAILRACLRAMHPEARLYLIERVVPTDEDMPEEEVLDAATLDLNMLVLVGGQERTLTQYEQLLVEAGFRDVRLLGEDGNVIEALPA